MLGPSRMFTGLWVYGEIRDVHLRDLPLKPYTDILNKAYCVKFLDEFLILGHKMASTLSALADCYCCSCFAVERQPSSPNQMTYILQLKKIDKNERNSSEGSDFATSPHEYDIIDIVGAALPNVFCFSHFQISLHCTLADHPNFTAPPFQSTIELSASPNGNSIHPLQAQHWS